MQFNVCRYQGGVRPDCIPEILYRTSARISAAMQNHMILGWKGMLKISSTWRSGEDFPPKEEMES